MERRLGVPYDDREDWPEIWNPLYRPVACSDNTQIEATRIREHDKSPFSAHLRKPVPLPWAGPEGGQSMVTKYFEKDVIRECLGRRV